MHLDSRIAPISPLPEKPRVCVAVCTFNGGRFLGEQLDSIARQSRAVDELIVCDDGSSDQTVAIAESFRSKIASLQLWQNPVRLGVTKNFEQAIGRCSGDVIFLSDQDDIWKPDKVEKLLAAMSASPAAAMAFSDADVIREDGSPAGYRLWDSIWFDRKEQQRMAEGDALPVLLRHAVPAGCTLVFRASYLPLILPMPDLPHVHDVWISLLLACVGRLAPVERPLISYRLHGQNIVGMRQYNLWGQLRMARHQLKSGAFAQLASLHRAARQRLVERPQWTPRTDALALLDEKIRHSELRDQLPARLPDRWGAIWSQWRSGGYRKYSYGIKSVLQDVFLR